MEADFTMVLKIFFLLNPLASVPMLFAAQRRGLHVKKIALQATLLAFIVALVFFAIGPSLFGIFGIDINSFRAAGGLVTLLLGISMIKEKKDGEDVSEEKTIISLIATPLLTGPATLSYLILTTREIGPVPVLVNLVLAFGLVGLLFNVFARLIPNISLEWVKFTSRLLGLFLVALGLEMLAAGVRAMLFG